MSTIKLTWSMQNETYNQHNPTFVIMCNEDMLKKYRVDSTIPLVEVVQSFDVWMYEKPGSEGKMVRPGHDLLKKYFGTVNDTEIIQFMIKNGAKHGEGKIPTHVHESLNPSRGARNSAF